MRSLNIPDGSVNSPLEDRYLGAGRWGGSSQIDGSRLAQKMMFSGLGGREFVPSGFGRTSFGQNKPRCSSTEDERTASRTEEEEEADGHGRACCTPYWSHDRAAPSQVRERTRPHSRGGGAAGEKTIRPGESAQPSRSTWHVKCIREQQARYKRSTLWFAHRSSMEPRPSKISEGSVCSSL